MIRKIHLDFHTHPSTEGIGAGFDPELFAETLAGAHVNCLATPGKCHFGNIYYASAVGRAHPHLARPDLFPATVAACARRGIRVQAYWTLGLDAYAAEQHPDWRQRFSDGRYANWGHYLHMCFASPYIERMVIPEIRECIERCPGLAGFWFDICLYLDGSFYSPGFDSLAAQRLGGHDSLAARWHLARQLIRERCIELDGAIRQRLPDAENYFNSLVVPGEAENIPLQPLQEVENPILFGGPEKMTAHVRWLRGHRAATIGLVSRFQGPWSDPGTLRTADQMRFDVARTVALGCHVSMGDHRYPDGHLEPEVYRRLAPVYADVERLGPWLDNAMPCREAVLLNPVKRQPGTGLIFPDLSPLATHASRLIEEIGLQFDLAADDEELPAADLIVWPGEQAGSPELLDRLRRHVARGGALLAMGAAIDGAEDLMGATVLPWRPATAGGSAGDTSGCGHVAAPVAHSANAGPTGHFMRLRPSLGGSPFSPILTHPARLIAVRDGEVLADRFAPVSDLPPFPSSQPAGPAIVQHGRVIYCAGSLFEEDAGSGSPLPREIVALLCDRLLRNRLVRHDAGPTVAAHLHRCTGGYLLHLVHWAINRWGKQVNSAAHFPTLGPITVTVTVPAPVRAVTLEPGGAPLACESQAAGCRFTVPSLHVWQAVTLAI